jgi:cobalt-zinc-cadmium efflux system outer membrane protein
LFLRGGALYNRELLETAGRPVGWEAAVEAGVTVPLFNRNRGGIAAARAEEAQGEANLRRLELALEARVAEVFGGYLTALRASEEYRTEVLPRAEEAFALYLDRYRNLAAAYPQVLVAQRTLFQMNASYLESLEAAWRAALQLQGFLPGDALDAPNPERATSEPTVATRLFGRSSADGEARR